MLTMNTSFHVRVSSDVISVNMKKELQNLAYHHGDLKKALLDASLSLIESEGYQSLTLRKVSKLAGVSQSAPYRHFTDLESLLAYIATDGFIQLATHLKKAQKQFARNALLQFREAGICYVQFALKKPDLFQIMYGNQIQDHSKYEILHKHENETFQVLVQIITECSRQKLIATTNLEKTAMAAWTMVHGIAVLLLGRQVMFKNRDLKQARKITIEMMETLYQGMKP
jgi:AcrR family transcriptional regulator